MSYIPGESKHIRFCVQISKEVFNEVAEQVESGYTDPSVLFILLLIISISAITFFIQNEAMIKKMTEMVEELFEGH